MDTTKDEIGKNDKVRYFGLSNLSINNSTSVFILTAIIFVVGLLSYIAMPKEQFPEIVMPTVYVNTIYPGNSPADIENLITRPLEKEIKSIKDIKEINSTSAQDVSAIVIEFNEDVQISDAISDVKDAVDKSKRELPTDLESDPQVLELDFSEIPVVVINISGDFEVDQLKGYAEDLEEEIEELNQVSRVDIIGAVDREIQINADLFKMQATNVTFQDIENAVKGENITVSGGDILTNGYRRSLRVKGEFDDPEEIKNIIVKNENDDLIYLGDIADVKDTYAERASFSRMATTSFIETGSSPVVSLLVIKKSGENLIEASQEIDKLLAKAKKTYLPPNLNIILTQNQASDMELQISNLENSIISGIILVVLVLLFFMGLRNAMLVGLAIPMSMLMSFMILSILGVTINMVVLFALILALGMLVDNAIVVIENIYRLREEGFSRMEAARRGVGEVAGAIISSTATTVAAFVPLAFWGGIMGEFMKYLPITLIIVLSSSLFVGLVINPVIARSFMKVAEGKKQPRKKLYQLLGFTLVGLGALMLIIFVATDRSLSVPNMLIILGVFYLLNAFVLKRATEGFQNRILTPLEKGYKKVLNWSLAGKRPYFIFGGTFGFLAIVMMFFGVSIQKGRTEVEFFPGNDPNYIYIIAEAPLGTDIIRTNKMAEEIEKKTQSILAPYASVVEAIVVNVGKNTNDSNEMSVGNSGATPHKFKISISFINYEDRKIDGKTVDTGEIKRQISKEFKNIPGLLVTTSQDQGGPPTGKPVSIEVTGENYATLIEEAEKIKNMISTSGISGLDGLKLELETNKPEIIVNIDRAKARQFGLSSAMLATDVRTAIYGREVSKFKDGEDEYPIQLRLQDRYRYDIAAINDQRITFRNNQGKRFSIPISAVADFDLSTSFGAIKRKDLDRLVVVSSNVQEGYNSNQVVNQIKLLLNDYKLPAGYAFRFGGEQEEQAESMAFLGRAMLIALAVIFLILVSQFNSLMKPFIILISILLSLTGVFLGLLLTGDSFVIIMTGIGIISLAGVVVNNAIVLIDYTDLVGDRKKKELGLSSDDELPLGAFRESLVEGGSTRLRPVLLTAITTVLGLIPLAIGLNIDFFGLFSSFSPNIYSGGSNADFWGPMAWTVIYGLVFATFLTLVIVPVMYLVFQRVYLGVRSLGTDKQSTQGQPELA